MRNYVIKYFKSDVNYLKRIKNDILNMYWACKITFFLYVLYGLVNYCSFIFFILKKNLIDKLLLNSNLYVRMRNLYALIFVAKW
jgi:hypothetical protein